jgi:hypothetical protein
MREAIHPPFLKFNKINSVQPVLLQATYVLSPSLKPRRPVVIDLLDHVHRAKTNQSSKVLEQT